MSIARLCEDCWLLLGILVFVLEYKPKVVKKRDPATVSPNSCTLTKESARSNTICPSGGTYVLVMDTKNVFFVATQQLGSNCTISGRIVGPAPEPTPFHVEG